MRRLRLGIEARRDQFSPERCQVLQDPALATLRLPAAVTQGQCVVAVRHRPGTPERRLLLVGRPAMRPP